METDVVVESVVLRRPDGPVALHLDARTGLPVALVLHDAGHDGDADERIALAVAVRLEVGGAEERPPTGGLVYPGAVLLTDVRLAGPPAPALDGTGLEVVTRVGDWELRWRWRLRDEAPRVALTLEARPGPGAAERVLRNLVLELDVALPRSERWLVQAPGNRLRPDVDVPAVALPVGVSPAGGLRGSSALVAATAAGRDLTVVLWPFGHDEIGDLAVRGGDGGLHLTVRTDLAGEPAPGAGLTWRELLLDVRREPWTAVRDAVRGWYPGLGVELPREHPDWVRRANILEVQIGFSVFAGGWRYAPYPDAEALLADLDRIAGLGVDVLQIMPRQPYPSYNVHDYADITTSYGDEEVLRELVARAHERGIRVLLDVLLHGVVDREVVRTAADAVRRGPYAARIATSSGDSFAADLNRRDVARVAWSRHILDFEPFWRDGSPEHHPLLAEHPEWFCRDSAGNTVGIYTHAFDLDHPGWQRYFTDSLLALVERLDVDGFRFDAPTYNYVANWSPRARAQASHAPLACVGLFRRLRPALLAAKPDLLMYTEPSGVLLRQSMDLTYNYDEQWLVSAVLGRLDPAESGWLVRTAREACAWLAERDALLPDGAVTAHHIDSHDTFWWPLPGGKWRREQFGLEATRALASLFALCGGAYMTFVGGELGIEEHLTALHRLRRTRPEIGLGSADHLGVRADDDGVAAILRDGGGRTSLVLVELAGREVDVATTLLRPVPHEHPPRDLLAAAARHGDAATREGDLVRCRLGPYGTRVLALHDVPIESRREEGSA